MFTKKEFRNDKNLVQKAQLLLAIMFSYMAGGILSGVLYYEVQNVTFVIVGLVLGTVLLYDYSKLQVTKLVQRRRLYSRRYVLFKKEA